MTTQYGTTAVLNIPACLGVGLDPRVEGESNDNDEFADYRALVGIKT